MTADFSLERNNFYHKNTLTSLVPKIVPIKTRAKETVLFGPKKLMTHENGKKFLSWERHIPECARPDTVSRGKQSWIEKSKQCKKRGITFATFLFPVSCFCTHS